MFCRNDAAYFVRIHKTETDSAFVTVNIFSSFLLALTLRRMLILGGLSSLDTDDEGMTPVMIAEECCAEPIFNSDGNLLEDY